jgi:hypothetical protein
MRAGVPQDPKELAKWRRKQSNREAARRSRARKAEQATGLAAQLAERGREYDALQVEKAVLQQHMAALHGTAERLKRDREALGAQVGAVEWNGGYCMSSASLCCTRCAV